MFCKNLPTSVGGFVFCLAVVDGGRRAVEKPARVFSCRHFFYWHLYEGSFMDNWLSVSCSRHIVQGLVRAVIDVRSHMYNDEIIVHD